MDTIVAIATAMGNGGIGIIRLSGKDTFSIIKKVFEPKNPGEIKGYSMKYGFIKDPQSQEIVDEVLVSYFKKPHSYTTEDMCEINSHGGMLVMKKILEICLKNGATLAEPGEFTKRAFLNGRIDLSQAEGIIDLINAKTEKETKASIKQLEGRLSKKIQQIRSQIIDNMVNIEASIDYPEYDVEEVEREKLKIELSTIKEQLRKLAESFSQGKIIKEGIKVAIIGKPNAGKSSLLNAFLGEERAIVTEIEGTTRDTIQETITIEGIPIIIIDTAGIRKTKQRVEEIGIKKAKETVEQADLVIAIFDNTKTWDDGEEEILKQIKGRRAILIINKIDIREENVTLEERLKATGKSIIKISAKEDIGISQINDEIARIYHLGEIDMENSDSVIISNIRHKNAIDKAQKSIEEAQRVLDENLPIDIIAIPMKTALEELGNITGENVSEEIISSIFAKFCLGK